MVWPVPGTSLLLRAFLWRSFSGFWGQELFLVRFLNLITKAQSGVMINFGANSKLGGYQLHDWVSLSCRDVPGVS